ncbi:MAG: hypothetical protein NC079_04265 [Clostridium sp.]|nr:hypothetical protein [Acetatifactor muris]MCM1526733.1 hypothetical protein [Bacteroides sp.]MCM1562807.1 hypothetical protein [Clostridium sp.]
MKRTVLNRIVMTLGAACCALTMIITPVQAAALDAAPAAVKEDPGIEPQAAIKEWIPKIENGKLYKRLFNHSTGHWEGDWIYVCDWPEDVPIP